MSSEFNEMNEFLDYETVPAADFSTPGDLVEGIIEGFQLLGVRNYETGEFEILANGKIKKQLEMTVNEGNMGPIRVFIRGQAIKAALKEAMASVGATSVQSLIGLKTTVVFTGFGEPAREDFDAPKLYDVTLSELPSSPARKARAGSKSKPTVVKKTVPAVKKTTAEAPSF